jgi:aryl-alcohol dehydrogenase-like predicted oxidoreductase
MTLSIGYAEKPYRHEPGVDGPDSDIYQATPEERAQTVQAALDAGITFFHAAHEREAASLGASLRALGIRDAITISTTDGDALDRCPDTEDGAASAITAAIARKQELLGVEVIDLFSLYDVRQDVHTPARIAGARRALEQAQADGHVRAIGATCYGDYDALTEIIKTGSLPLKTIQARYNYADPRATDRLFPACRASGVQALAAQTFAWYCGIPFVRFPNTWRYRNLTKNFYGFTAAQAHLYWVLTNPDIDGAVVSMQTPEQVTENVAAAHISKTPIGLESLFISFVEAITTTREGWRGLLQDDLWEYRAAAEAFLARRKP